MPYTNRIKMLEESLRLVETQINSLKNSNIIDESKLKSLVETRNKYISDLRDLRRSQYEERQVIDYDDDR